MGREAMQPVELSDPTDPDGAGPDAPGSSEHGGADALWSADDGATLSALDGGSGGDLRVGGYVDELGQRSVRAVRTRTGQVVWSTVLNGPLATGPQAFGGAPLCSMNDQAETPRRLLCLVNNGMSELSADGHRSTTASTSARLVALDPATGEQQAQRDVPASASRAAGVLDGLAVGLPLYAAALLFIAPSTALTGYVHCQFESPE